MPQIPLILKLKKQAHKSIAEAQDIIVKELYAVFDKAVLHGGTSIWRCYGGNRFSEDVDVYIPNDKTRIDSLFESLKKNGFLVHKKKVTQKSLYSSMELNRAIVRLEALFKKPIPKGGLKEYETSNGNIITVYTLTPEELIKEKIGAYPNRLKIRDLYDIFFLLRHVKSKGEILKDLRKLIRQFKKPIDEKDLRVLIIEGLVPDTEGMLDFIKREAGM